MQPKKEIKEIKLNNKIDNPDNLLNIKIINNNKDDNNLKKKNEIKGILEINSNDIMQDITLFNSNIQAGIDVYLNQKKINMMRYKNIWRIYHNFVKEGKYEFKIFFRDIITDTKAFFEYSFNIIFLDLSNFNTSKVTNMSFMFNKCRKLKEIKGINKFNTCNVSNMAGMFQECNELESLDLSNFKTSKVIVMYQIWQECFKNVMN